LGIRISGKLSARQESGKESVFHSQKFDFPFRQSPILKFIFPQFRPMKPALFTLILKYLFEFSLRHSILPLP